MSSQKGFNIATFPSPVSLTQGYHLPGLIFRIDLV